MNNITEEISLNNSVTLNKVISITNNGYILTSKELEIRVVSADDNNLSDFVVIDNVDVSRESILSAFIWSNNIRDNEKYMILSYNNKIIEISPFDTYIDLSPFNQHDDYEINVSAYFNNYATSSFLMSSIIPISVEHISVNWNLTNTRHLYFSNYETLTQRSYNLNNLAINSWNNADIISGYKGIFIDTDILSGALNFDSNSNISGPSAILSENILSSFNSVNLPLNAGFISDDNRMIRVDTYDDVYIHIIDAKLKESNLNFIVNTNDSTLLRQTIENRLLSDSLINWINIDSNMRSVNNISFDESALLNDSIDVSFSLSYIDPNDQTNYLLKNELLTFNFINGVNWKSETTFYINAGEQFDLVSTLCNIPVWKIDNEDDSFTKIIRPEVNSLIYNAYNIESMNSDNVNLYTIMNPTTSTTKIYNTVVNAELVTENDNLIADQFICDIVVCSGNILMENGNLYNTENTIEIRNNELNKIPVDSIFTYQYLPNEIQPNFNIEFTENSIWNIQYDAISGINIITNDEVRQKHIDNIETNASAFLQINNNFIIKPIKEFKIVEYGSPIILDSIRPTFLFKTDEVPSSNLSLLSYKDYSNIYDEKISVNSEIMLSTNMESISGVTNFTSLPENISSWSDFIENIPGFYIDDNGILQGKITDMNCINALTNYKNYPYSFEIDEVKYAIVVDSVYLSSNTTKSDELYTYQNFPSGLILNNNIPTEILSGSSFDEEYNVNINVYDVLNNTSSLLLNENIAKLLFFNYKFKDNEYIMRNELESSNNSFISDAWNSSEIFNWLYQNSDISFGLSSNIKYNISGNNLTSNITSSGIQLQNQNKQYEALTGIISAYAVPNNDFSNCTELLLDTSTVLIPFIPEISLKLNYNASFGLYNKYYQINHDSDAEINVYNFIQEIGETFTDVSKDKIIWKSNTIVNDINDDGSYSMLQDDYGIIIFESGKILNIENSYGNITSTVTNSELTSEGYDSLSSIFVTSNNSSVDITYMFIGAGLTIPTSSSKVEIDINYLNRKCIINSISFNIGIGDSSELLTPNAMTLIGYDNDNVIFTENININSDEYYDIIFDNINAITKLVLRVTPSTLHDTNIRDFNVFFTC